MRSDKELFTPEFYKDLVTTQAQTNATLQRLADRLGDATDGISQLVPLLSSHETRLCNIERNISATKRAAKWAASILASSIGAFLTYRKQIVDTLKQLFHQ